MNILAMLQGQMPVIVGWRVQLACWIKYAAAATGAAAAAAAAVAAAPIATVGVIHRAKAS